MLVVLVEMAPALVTVRFEESRLLSARSVESLLRVIVPDPVAVS